MISEITRTKMREAHKGKKMPPRSALWKKRQSKAQKRVKRYPRSEMTKKKIGDAQRGRKNHMWGKHNTDEQKRKIRKALQGREFSIETRQKISNALIGDKHPNWKGGLTRVKELIRTNSRYRLWRKKVLKRDHFRCVLCDSIKNLEVDHYPKTIAYIIKKYKITSLSAALLCVLLWDIRNGRTLCIKCHRL